MSLNQLLKPNPKLGLDIYVESIDTPSVKCEEGNVTIDTDDYVRLTGANYAAGPYSLGLDASNNIVPISGSGSSLAVKRLSGTQAAVDTTNTSTIIGNNALILLTLQSLANGYDGQSIKILAVNGGEVLIKHNTIIGDDQPFFTASGLDMSLPIDGDQIGAAIATYDATFGYWIVARIA